MDSPTLANASRSLSPGESVGATEFYEGARMDEPTVPRAERAGPRETSNAGLLALANAFGIHSVPRDAVASLNPRAVSDGLSPGESISERSEEIDEAMTRATAGSGVGVVGGARKSVLAGSTVFVYPPTPLIEIVGTALFCNRLERTDFDTVV